MSNILELVKTNLQDKIIALNSIKSLDENMIEQLGSESPDIDIYAEYLEKSEELRKQIDSLETEFQALLNNKEVIPDSMKNSDASSAISSLANTVDELASEVLKLEKKVQTLSSSHFGKVRSDIQKSRQALKVAKGYSDVQYYGGALSPQFMDNKQ